MDSIHSLAISITLQAERFFGCVLAADVRQSANLFKNRKIKIEQCICVREIKRSLHLSVVSSAYKVHLGHILFEFGSGCRFYVGSNRQDKTNKDGDNHHLELVFF